MKNRAVFLPTPGDPLLLRFWLLFYRTYWQDEISRLYIYLNTPADDFIISYIKGLIKDEPKIKLIHVRQQVQHGDCLAEMLKLSKEKYVMFIEDDAIVFKSGYIDKCFKLLEKGEADMVVSRRGCCSPEIQQAAEAKFNFLTYGLGDRGTGFWPCFFWCRRDLLEKTDLDFKAKTWQAGEYIEPLNLTLKADGVADTFVWGSIQLQAMKPVIAEVPQYHLSTDDVQDYNNQVNVFDGKAGWFHIGSLSSGVHGVLMGLNNRSLNSGHFNDPINYDQKIMVNYRVQSEAEKLEWERRVCFWKMFADFYEDEPILSEYHSQYLIAIDRVIDQFGLNPTRIEKRVMLFKKLLKMP